VTPCSRIWIPRAVSCGPWISSGNSRMVIRSNRLHGISLYGSCGGRGLMRCYPIALGAPLTHAIFGKMARMGRTPSVGYGGTETGDKLCKVSNEPTAHRPRRSQYFCSGQMFTLGVAAVFAALACIRGIHFSSRPVTRNRKKDGPVKNAITMALAPLIPIGFAALFASFR
jgi:hypothetical protein